MPYRDGLLLSALCGWSATKETAVRSSRSSWKQAIAGAFIVGTNVVITAGIPSSNEACTNESRRLLSLLGGRLSIQADPDGGTHSINEASERKRVLPRHDGHLSRLLRDRLLHGRHLVL